MINSYNDNQLIFNALNMWANYIETGSVIHPAESAKRVGDLGMINALSTDQMRLIIRLRDLALKTLNGESR